MMRILQTLSVALVLGALLPAALAAQVDPDPHPGEDDALTAAEEAALGAAERWLEAVDADQFERSWREAGGIFRSALDAASWSEQMSQIRRQVGAVADREFAAVETRTNPPDSPPGEYIAVAYVSVFAHASDVTEVVVTTQEGGAWKVVGYFIRP